MYILKEYQGKGIGKWLIECVNENIDNWPEMRWILLVTNNATKFYEENLNMTIFGKGADGSIIMSKEGPGAHHDP